MTQICLIGMPGVGKSTIGRRLAKRIGVQFVDSDQFIELEFGRLISSFFEIEGESRFRDIESEAIKKLTAQEFGVLATGGGAILREENRHHLRRAYLVYLRSSPEELYRRLKGDVNRPLLRGDDPLGTLRQMYVVREPLYMSSANYVIDTGRASVAVIVDFILKRLELNAICIRAQN